MDDIKNNPRERRLQTVPPYLLFYHPTPKMTCPTVSSSATAAAVLLLSLLLIPSASSFGVVSISVPAHLGVSPSSSCSPTCLRATTAESEAEALLRRARELKAAAAEAEKQVHDTLLSKKAQRDAETDKVIDHFFPHDGADGDMDLAGLVQRIKSKRPSSDLLLRVVDRLHERECAAQGLAHVEPSVHHDHTEFHVKKSEVDEQELKRVGGLIDRLIDAAKVLDEEWYQEKQAKGDPYRNHNELVHWAAGDVAKALTEKAKDLRREHDDRFKKRQAEFYDAAKKKDKQKYFEQEF